MTAFQVRKSSNALKTNSFNQNMTRQSFKSLRLKNQGRAGDQNMNGTFVGSVSATTPFETFNTFKKEKN